MKMPDALRIEINPTWDIHKISPTYLSSNLVSPLQLPFRETVPRCNIITEGTAGRCLNKQWGTFSTEYGGVGHLPVGLLGKVGKPRRELPASRSHRHFTSGLTNTIHNVIPTRYVASLRLPKSKQRHSDEIIPQPLTLGTNLRIMREENHFIQEPVYSSHASRNVMFPKSRAEFDSPGLDADLCHRYPLVSDTDSALKHVTKDRYKLTTYKKDFSSSAPQPELDLKFAKESDRRRKYFSACEQAPKHVQMFQNCVTKPIVPGVWPVWPAGANSIVSNITGKIIEKRDVISLDDQIDFTRYKMAEVFDPRRAPEKLKCPYKPPAKLVDSFGSSKLVPMTEPMFEECGRFSKVNEPLRTDSPPKIEDSKRPSPAREAWSSISVEEKTPENIATCCVKCDCSCNAVAVSEDFPTNYRSTYYRNLMEIERRRQKRENAIKNICNCHCDDNTKSNHATKRLTERVCYIEEKKSSRCVEVCSKPSLVKSTEDVKQEKICDDVKDEVAEKWEDSPKKTSKQVSFNDNTEIIQSDSDEILKHPEIDFTCWGHDRRDMQRTGLAEQSGDHVYEYGSREHDPYSTFIYKPMASAVCDQDKDPFKGGKPIRNKDPYVLNMQLDRDEESCSQMLDSAEVQMKKIDKYNALLGKSRAAAYDKVATYNIKPSIKLPPTPMWETLDYVGGRVADRLGVRFKTVASKRYHGVHPETIPDLRDFRPPLRKSDFLGYHTSVFR